jgi:hypothetical protein
MQRTLLPALLIVTFCLACETEEEPLALPYFMGDKADIDSGALDVYPLVQGTLLAQRIDADTYEVLFLTEPTVMLGEAGTQLTFISLPASSLMEWEGGLVERWNWTMAGTFEFNDPQETPGNNAVAIDPLDAVMSFDAGAGFNRKAAWEYCQAGLGCRTMELTLGGTIPAGEPEPAS